MEDAASGRYAETRRRQSGFHRPGKDTKETEERKMREAAKQEELEKKYKVWNKGVAQLKQVSKPKSSSTNTYNLVDSVI